MSVKLSVSSSLCLPTKPRFSQMCPFHFLACFAVIYLCAALIINVVQWSQINPSLGEVGVNSWLLFSSWSTEDAVDVPRFPSSLHLMVQDS